MKTFASLSTEDIAKFCVRINNVSRLTLIFSRTTAME
ncbi:unnamed protein product [Brugia timori]|uniref:Transcriptional regulator n=1 Tax=Brugia timori TaxID=42155 RepID=A0A0R3QDN6_9BILA|nr:unnamed protein product [Brugia timori]